MREADCLKLVALDEEDLAVVSAHVQDAVLKVGDLLYLPREHRFAIAMNRFAWEKEGEGGRPSHERRRTALTFDRVLSVKTSCIRREEREAALELLAVHFTVSEAPGGIIDIVFAGGGTVRLEVECIEARLADLGPAWAARQKPAHDLAGEPAKPG